MDSGSSEHTEEETSEPRRVPHLRESARSGRDQVDFDSARDLEPQNMDKLRRRRPYEPVGRGKRLDKHCEQLLAQLKRVCPDIIADDPLPPGEVAVPVEVTTKDLTQLIRTAARPTTQSASVIWENAGSELLVHTAKIRVEVLNGLVLIGIPVETDQTKAVTITVPIAIGQQDRLAGMVATTEPRPRGPDVIVDRWGDALIAAAWDSLLAVTERIAAVVGSDTDGAPLRPGALVAEGGALSIVPQARHSFEKKIAG